MINLEQWPGLRTARI